METSQFFIEIQYTKSADKFFRRHEKIRADYEDAMIELMFGDHPEQYDVKSIVCERNDYYRIRIGGYRIIYTVIKSKIVVVTTLLAGPRGDIYKKMKGID